MKKHIYENQVYTQSPRETKHFWRKSQVLYDKVQNLQTGRLYAAFF